MENLLEMWPGSIGTTRHDGRTVSSTFFTTRDTGTDKVEALGFEVLGSSDGVWVVRVTTVDQDVSLFEVRSQLVDEGINGRASLDEDDDLSGSLEGLDEFLNGLATNDVGSLGFVVHKVVDLGSGSVVGGNGESLVVHVEDQVLTHDGQADETDVSTAEAKGRDRCLSVSLKEGKGDLGRPRADTRSIADKERIRFSSELDVVDGDAMKGPSCCRMRYELYHAFAPE